MARQGRSLACKYEARVEVTYSDIQSSLQQSRIFNYSRKNYSTGPGYIRFKTGKIPPFFRVQFDEET